MNLEKNQEIKVYSGEHGYFTRLAKRDVSTDDWKNAFFYLQFKKGVEIPNKTKIRLLDSWLSFYINKDNKQVFYVFVNDYEVIEDDSDEE